MSQLNSSQAGDEKLFPLLRRETSANRNRFSSSLFFFHFIIFLLLPLNSASLDLRQQQNVSMFPFPPSIHLDESIIKLFSFLVLTFQYWLLSFFLSLSRELQNFLKFICCSMKFIALEKFIYFTDGLWYESEKFSAGFPFCFSPSRCFVP